MDNEDDNVRQLIGEITALVTALPPALERRAAEIDANGKDADMIDKLTKELEKAATIIASQNDEKQSGKKKSSEA